MEEVAVKEGWWSLEGLKIGVLPSPHLHCEQMWQGLPRLRRQQRADGVQAARAADEGDGEGGPATLRARPKGEAHCGVLLALPRHGSACTESWGEGGGSRRRASNGRRLEERCREQG